MRQSRYSSSLQLGVFRLHAREYWNIGVGVSPEREKVLVACFRFDLVSHKMICPAQLHVGQSAYGIGIDDSAMIENFLEFRHGFPAPPCCEVRLAAHIRRIDASEVGKECRARQREV